MRNYSLLFMPRHCEEQRSEAIHKDFPGLPRRFAPRNDGIQGTSSYGFSSNEEQVPT